VITAGFLEWARFGFMINAKVLNAGSRCREKTTIASAFVTWVDGALTRAASPRQCLASRLHDNPVESSVRDNQAGLDHQADSPGPASENDKVQVEQVNRDLVARDDEGKPYSVRYEAVNAMLLSEFVKEHRKVGQQQRKWSRATRRERRDPLHTQRADGADPEGDYATVRDAGPRRVW